MENRNKCNKFIHTSRSYFVGFEYFNNAYVRIYYFNEIIHISKVVNLVFVSCFYEKYAAPRTSKPTFHHFYLINVRKCKI